MKTALVLGGTRFFGLKLVDKLIQDKFKVTIATRGNRSDPYGDKIERVIIERTNFSLMKKVFDARTWDIVYDQICYSPSDAADACYLFTGKTGRYIFASSQAVYPAGRGLKEEAFNPYHCQLKLGRQQSFSYSEGKRLAEAYFFQKAKFPVVAVRFPSVLGIDDYTKKLKSSIQSMKNKKSVLVENKDAVISLIASDTAADFLFYQRDKTFSGPMNACSLGEISIEKFVHTISKELNIDVSIKILTNQKALSPYNVHTAWETNPNLLPYSVHSSWSMEPSLASSNGYLFPHLNDWLSDLIGDTIKLHFRQ